jgi:hypothetical protein
LIGGNIDLDLLSLLPQKDERIMGGMEEGGQDFKVNNGGEINSFGAQPKEEEGVFIPPPPAKNVTIAVPGAEYLSSRGGFSAPLPRIIWVKTRQKSTQRSAHILGANHQKFEGADYPAQTWADNPAWKNLQHENGVNFCIWTPFSMILGSLESPQ